MSTLKERAREIAEGCLPYLCGGSGDYEVVINALLAFAKEVLEREPSDAMLRAFWIATGCDQEKMGKLVPLTGSGNGDLQMVTAWENASVHFNLSNAYRSMSAVRAKELEE